MSFQAMTWAVEQELPAMQKIVLLMLANRTNHDTGLCFPSHDTLAKECGMDKRSVIRQIESLEKAKLLTVVRTKKADGSNNPNHYRLKLKGGSDTESLGVVSESHQGGDTESPKPGTKPKRTVVVTREKIFLNFDDLTADEKDCYHWALTQPYWSSSTSSIDNFKSVYDKPSPKGLRVQYDAHKKALNLGKDAGLNVKSQKNTGVNYATNNTNNTKLCAADRIRNKAILRQAEAERAELERNAFAHNDNDINITDYQIHATE